MALSGDTLLERMHLKRQLSMWRLVAIAVAIFFLVQLIEFENGISPVSGDFIARVTVKDVIVDDPKRNKLLDEIRDNDNVKALIVHLDTPGGTAMGGEVLYRKLKSIREKKPVIAVMRTVCASAGYMTAIAAERIYALEGTITGSIGVIMQTADMTEMAKKIGITPIILKSGPNKASPNPAEKFTDEQRAVTKIALDDFFQIFLDMVIKERPLNAEEVLSLADGRIYTGRQAVKNKLIDEIGDEDDALKWLHENKKLSDKLEVKDMKVKKEKPSFLEQLADVSGLSFIGDTINNRHRLDGMLMMWQPSNF